MTLTELLTYQIEKYTELLAIASTDPARAFAREEVWRLKRKKMERKRAIRRLIKTIISGRYKI